jgi:transcription termination factor NusB
MTGHAPGTAIEERLSDDPLDGGLSDFVRQIVIGVLPITNKLDNLIAQNAPEWPMDQVAVIDRNIIRIALLEFEIHYNILPSSVITRFIVRMNAFIHKTHYRKSHFVG